MNLTRLGLLALFLSSAACAKSSADPVTGDPQNLVEDDHLTTGVGAHLSWKHTSSRTWSDSLFIDTSTWEVTYSDDAGYFGDAPSLGGVFVSDTQTVHKSSTPDSEQTQSKEVVLTKTAPHVYEGTFSIDLRGYAGDSQTNLYRLDIAVHDGDKWDSNYGANYPLQRDYR